MKILDYSYHPVGHVLLVILE